MPPEATLARRIAFKSLGAVLALPLNLLLQLMVPRGLGAVAYGEYTFLSAFFNSVLAFADSGSSQAFYNKLSQRPDEPGLSGFYARFSVAVLLGVLLVVGGARVTGVSAILWPGFPILLVLLAAVMVFGNWVIALASKAVDAFGLTAWGEGAALAVRLLLVLSVSVCFIFGLLSARSFFSLQIVFNTVLIACLAAVLARAGRASAFVRSLTRGEAVRYGAEFWAYSHPLLTVSLATLLAEVLDRWLLQRLAGSAQQGYLGLGLQLGSVVFIFGGAVASLLAREFARAHHSADFDLLRAQFVRYLPRAYAVTAYFGVFLAVEADALVRMVGGDQFALAGPATAALCLYPLHQVYGQVGNSLMYATERTRAMRGISLIGLALGLILTAFFLAPRASGGLGLGALGIAGKVVLHQIVIVNVVLWSNARFLNIPFLPQLGRQLATPTTLAGCALATRAVVGMAGLPLLLAFLMSGALYTALVALVAWRWPATLGFDRSDARQAAARLRGAFARRGA